MDVSALASSLLIPLHRTLSTVAALGRRISLLLGALALSAHAQTATTTLTVFNWEDYLAPAVVAAFEQRYGVQVRELHYQTDALKDEWMAAHEGRGVDVIIGSGISFLSYRALGWLAPLEPEQLPNLRHLETRWQTHFEGLQGYAVPYLWGINGIAYRRDKLATPVASWLDLLLPTPALRGKVLMIDDGRESLGIALKALGYSYNSENPEQLSAAYRLLQAQKPFVWTYGYVETNPHSSLVSGETWITPVYNGDALVLQALHPDIAFAIPAEGVNLWVDYLAVSRHSRNRTLAMQFINFLHEPEQAARTSLVLKYATPNRAARALLPPAHLNNPLIYPDPDRLANAEPARPLSVNAQRLRQQLLFQLAQ